jgi:hypothetical protein
MGATSMTTRTLAGVFIKLIGLYMGASTLHALGSMLSFLLPPFHDAVDMSPRWVWANIPGMLVGLAIAAVFIGYGDRIAGALFAEQPAPIVIVSAGDLLRIGICLVGLMLAASAVPSVLRTAGAALWYSGADRQSQFGAVVGRMWSETVDGALSFVAGVLLVVFARPLAALLSPKAAVPTGE